MIIETDIYSDPEFRAALAACADGTVYFEGWGWGVLSYTEDCGRLDPVPLFVNKDKADAADWIDLSEIMQTRGVHDRVLISRAVYQTCVRSDIPRRENANVCSLIDSVEYLGGGLVEREVHTWIAGSRRWGVTYLEFEGGTYDDWRITLDRDDEVVWDSGATVAVPDHEPYQFANPNWQCIMPYCRHWRDPDFDAPYDGDVTYGECNRDGCDCGDAYSHYGR